MVTHLTHFFDINEHLFCLVFLIVTVGPDHFLGFRTSLSEYLNCGKNGSAGYSLLREILEIYCFHGKATSRQVMSHEPIIYKIKGYSNGL